MQQEIFTFTPQVGFEQFKFYDSIYVSRKALENYSFETVEQNFAGIHQKFDYYKDLQLKIFFSEDKIYATEFYSNNLKMDNISLMDLEYGDLVGLAIENDPNIALKVDIEFRSDLLGIASGINDDNNKPAAIYTFKGDFYFKKDSN